MIDIKNLPAPVSNDQMLIYNMLAGKEAYKVSLTHQDDLYFKAMLEYIQSIKPPANEPQTAVKRTRKASKDGKSSELE